MRKVALLISLSIAILLSPSIVKSQDAGKIFLFQDVANRWTSETGIMLTESSRRGAVKAIALDIGSEAHSAGIDSSTTAKWTDAFTRSGIIVITPNSLLSKGAEGEAELPFSDAMQRNVADNLKYETVAMRLYRMARIVIAVEPVPPRDYLIEINGESVESTERSEYAVEPGFITVTVKRSGKADCAWAGTLTENQSHPLQCKM